jgi:hypothetical protein
VFKEKLGDTINMKYAISGFPTFLIMDASGNLLSRFTGFKDAGLLFDELNTAKQKAKENETLSGFAASFNNDYPAFYKKIYLKDEDKRTDPAAINAWFKQQKDLTTEPVAVSIFRTGALDSETEDYLLQNYKKYRALYGEDLVEGKATQILLKRMEKATGKSVNEAAFRHFLQEEASLIPTGDWRKVKFVLGYSYYASMAKDTIKLLQFINEDPLVHANYVGSLYNNMLEKKQLSGENLSLLCRWADKAVTKEQAFDMISTAADMHKRNNDIQGFKKFVNMAIAKAKKYEVPVDGYEKMLTAK